MPKYRLNINFNETDLRTIYKANEKVIVVKHTAGDSDSQVAWVSFAPFMENTIDWETEFAIYASTTQVEDGAVINKLSDKSAATKIQYKFLSGIFQDASPVPTLGDNTYALSNQMQGYDGLTFGLAQNVVVNGEAFANHPINAIFVPYGQSIDMTPIEKVDVYLKSDLNDGTVISHLSSIVLPVEYADSSTEHTVKYDGSTGKFFPVN